MIILIIIIIIIIKIICNKETNCFRKSFFISKSLNITRKPAFTHFDKHENSKLTKSVVYTKWSNVIGCYAQRRIVIGLGKSCHCQTRLESRFPWNEKLERKQNWTAKSTNLKESVGKVKSVFVTRVALWAEKL